MDFRCKHDDCLFENGWGERLFALLICVIFFFIYELLLLQA